MSNDIGNGLSSYDIEDLADRIEGTLRTDYSGRGMYGKSCLAITFEGGVGKLVELGYAIAEIFGTEEGIDPSTYEAGAYGEEQYASDLRRARQGQRLASCAQLDSMGLGSVVYFPRFSVSDGE